MRALRPVPFFDLRPKQLPVAGVTGGQRLTLKEREKVSRGEQNSRTGRVVPRVVIRGFETENTHLREWLTLENAGELDRKTPRRVRDVSLAA